MQIQLLSGDITRHEADAIVNAANSSLLGVYGYPLEMAAPVAIEAVRGAITRIEEVRFVLFDDAAMAAFQRAQEAAL